MITIFLLVAAAVLMQCDIAEVGEQRSSYSKLRWFQEVENGARRKRYVIKEYVDNVTTWKDGLFYVFNTSARDKIIVLKEESCWSDIGRRGGDQFLSLTDISSTEWSAVHEIGHALGLLHTMSRHDRDSFIKIAFENVDPLYISEFDKIDGNYTKDYGLSYDYGSVMHYGERTASINNKSTVVSIDPLYQNTMGSAMIAFSDIFVINEHYGCNGRACTKCNRSTSAKCANEGFPHPRNCSVCICPGGYGGDLCDQRPPGCGEDLKATNEKQLLTERVGRGMGLRDNFDFCYYMIMAPTGKKVEVDLLSISSGYEDNGCRTGGVEIKAQKDQKMTGYRFCSEKGSQGPIVSTSNRLPVILYNKRDSMQAAFTYRCVD